MAVTTAREQIIEKLAPPAHLTAEEILAEIPQEVRVWFQTDFDRLVEVNRAHTDEAERELIDSLMNDAEGGTFPYKGETRQVNPHIDLAPDSAAAIRSRVSTEEEDPKKQAIRWLGIMAISIIVVLLFNVLTSRRGGGGNGEEATVPPGPSESAAVLTPGVISPLTPGVSLPGATPVSVESIFDEVKLNVPLFYPRTLVMAERVYYLVPTDVGPTTPWQIPQQAGAASWINGTVVNYVIGVPYLEAGENAQVMESLLVGDELQINWSTGTGVTFVVTEKRRVGRQDTGIFRQNAMGITIVLTGDPASDRLVIFGEYDVAPELASGYIWGPGGGAAYKVWERAESGTMAVEIDSAIYYTPTNPVVQGYVPSGQTLYIVNFRLENIGSLDMRLSEVQIEARDRSDLRYPSMEQLAQRYGSQEAFTFAQVVTEKLAPGSAITLSAAYMVPEDMAFDLLWVITPPDGEPILYDLTPGSLVVPPTPTPPPSPTVPPAPTATPVPQPRVVVSSAIIVEQPPVTPTHDLFLVLAITVTNPTTTPLQVRWDYFALVCSGDEVCNDQPEQYPPAAIGEYEGRMANTLPVTIPGDGEVALLLVFDIADVPAVIKFIAGNQEFAIRLK